MKKDIGNMGTHGCDFDSNGVFLGKLATGDFYKMKKDSKIFVSGHNGLVGSEILKTLKNQGYTNIITRSHKKLDLTNQIKTKKFFKKNKPEFVFVAAAKVGGIIGNSKAPAEFVYNNLQIQLNVIHYAYEYCVKKLVFLGSSCIYPKMCPQPIKEDYLMTGLLESSNDGYAVAKIAGITMCNKYNFQYDTKFISLMPTNLYGSSVDNYDLENSHVLPAMIRKFHEAKKEEKPQMELWGTGSPMREFLHVKDMAESAVFCMNNYEDYEQHVNIGTGVDVTIKEVAEIVKKVVGYEGEIVWDTDKPDGTPRKLLDVSKINDLGWKHTIEIEDGIKSTYKELLENHPLFK